LAQLPSIYACRTRNPSHFSHLPPFTFWKMLSLLVAWCVFSFHASAFAQEMPGCSEQGDLTCQDAKLANLADLNADELGVQLVQTRSMSKFSQAQDCCNLPNSMQGTNFPKGCPGAVWSSGSPASGYCSGSNGKYPWWAQCCEFTDGSCQAKEGMCVTTTPGGAASTTPASPGWYLSGVDQSCTAGCAAQGLQCFESQQKANNGDVDSSAELKALITQVGGSTNAQFCLDPHGNNPDVPSFGPSYCFHSETTRSLATFDCDQVPVPASENKQRLCYCADTEAPTTTAAPTEAVPPGCSPQAGPMLASMDTDKSGDLSQAECEAYAESNRSPKAEGTQVFTMLDANKDGKVTHAELCAFFGR